MNNLTLAALTAVGVFFAFKIIAGTPILRTPQYFTLADIKSRDAPPPANLDANAKELVKNMNLIQFYLYKENPTYKMRIHSTYRSPAHNAAVNGATKSYHMQARAVDFSVQNMQPQALHKFLYKLMKQGKIPRGGIGQGSSYAHFDNKGTVSTWKYGAGNNSYSVPLSTLE